MSLKQGRFVERTVVYVGAVLVFLLVAFPLYGVVLTSLQREEDVRSTNVNFFPTYVTFEHFAEVLRPGHIVPIREAMTNSIVISALTAVVTVTLALPATYALTRLRLPGRRFIIAALIAVYLFPTLLFVLPIYIQAVQWGLTDTFQGLLIPYVAFSLPFTIWILRGFLESLPVEIEEAAQLDGCNQLQLFTQIVVPLMRPGLVAGLLMVFILAWVEFLTPLLFTSDLKILPVSLGLYRSTYDIKIGQLAAAAVLTALPVLALTTLFQRMITEVITAGAHR
ncbi:MAG: carbohydrate ABC transporter permease [Chloroflexi bacterium]|nr:carbohydrate ABC transporter permease [Chloroflexota bacterium]